jgi:serine/threonine-protein kinase
MELLEGETLAARRRRAPALTVRQALWIVRQAARALAAAHAAGIVHRDLKPHNVFLVPDADLPGGVRVKILDFGIAKLSDERSAALTGEQSVIGTPRYMSPEQCRGAARVDQRADVYALGCILYELVCGSPPFVAEGAGELIAKHIFEPPTPLGGRALDVDPALSDFVARCLAKEPDERPASMPEVAEALDRLVEAAPDVALAPTAPPPSVAEPGETATSASRVAEVGLASTLGSSAAEVQARRARPASRWLLGGGLFALGLAGVVFYPSSPPAVVALPVPDAATVVGVDASPPPPPARRETVVLQITSEPAGAAILRAADEGWFGQTPHRRRVAAADGQIDLVVRKKGYAERRVVLRTDEDGTAHVVLDRLVAGRRPAPAPAVTSTSTPADAGPIGDGYLDPFAAPGRGDAGVR